MSDPFEGIFSTLTTNPLVPNMQDPLLCVEFAVSSLPTSVSEAPFPPPLRAEEDFLEVGSFLTNSRSNSFGNKNFDLTDKEFEPFVNFFFRGEQERGDEPFAVIDCDSKGIAVLNGKKQEKNEPASVSPIDTTTFYLPTSFSSLRASTPSTSSTTVPLLSSPYVMPPVTGSSSDTGSRLSDGCISRKRVASGRGRGRPKATGPPPSKEAAYMRQYRAKRRAQAMGSPR